MQAPNGPVVWSAGKTRALSAFACEPPRPSVTVAVASTGPDDPAWHVTLGPVEPEPQPDQEKVSASPSGSEAVGTKA